MLPLKQVAYIKASNAEAYDHFACGGGNQGHTGNSIGLSGDGSTMAIGAPFESSGSAGINGNQNDNSTYASGAVYVFVRQGDSWTQQAYVKASNPGQSDHFGSSVVLSRDGNTMAVAAHWEASAAAGINGNQNDNSIPQAGAVYIFTRTGATWTQQAYIKASNTGKAGQGDVPGDGDQFGFSLALSGDGSTLAVGAITEDSAAQQINGNQNDDSAQSAGAVYVFTRTGSTWAQQAYLKSSHAEAGDDLGFPWRSASTATRSPPPPSMRTDQAGRSIHPTTISPMNSGALYVFTRQNGGWSQQAYIKGSKGETSDGFGFATAISEDGNTIAVGSGDEACLTPGIDPPGCADDAPPLRGANIWVGAAYVFVRTGTTWTEQAFIKANNARPYNSFGVRLSLSGDGNTLAVIRLPRGQRRPGRPAADDPAVPAPGHAECMAGAPERGRGIRRGVCLHAQRQQVDGWSVRQRLQHRCGRRVRQRRRAQRRRQNHGGRRPPRGQRRQRRQRQPSRQLGR